MTSRFLCAAVFYVLALFPLPGGAGEETDSAKTYSYRVVNRYPHDPQAFTQGLAWDNGTVYEGTGLLGRSSLRHLDLPTGKVKQKHDLAHDFFGEGITVLGDTLYQLTWKNHLAFVYNKHDFSLQRTIEYPRPGWGITHDNRDLIASDGTANLYFLDPETLAEKRRITVHDGRREIFHLNELEYVEGKVYANIYKSDHIAIINPLDGHVDGWLNLVGLRDQLQLPDPQAVLNGIMYNAPQGRLFVTGKLWPLLFEIQVVPVP